MQVRGLYNHQIVIVHFPLNYYDSNLTPKINNEVSTNIILGSAIQGTVQPLFAPKLLIFFPFMNALTKFLEIKTIVDGRWFRKKILVLKFCEKTL